MAAPAATSGPGTGSNNPLSAARPTYSGNGRVVVNNATNTLIFRGSNAEEQQQIRQLLRELDRPSKSAMIEVVVAEMSVGALQRLGVQWTLNNQHTISDARSASIGGSGFSISYGNSARQVLSAIDALASGQQARILSNPKVLARNGETASIQVGSEVPIVTSQQSNGVGSGPFPGVQTGVLQQIQYRSTGVILRVRPVINSGNRLDLEVSQEVSSAASTETGVSSTPTISTRRIETKLSLRDGSTVLLGGLISRDTNNSDAGVPLLKDIPLIGALFRNKTENSNERELLVMITPYVINDDFEAEEITEAIHKTFGSWADDIKTSRVVKHTEALSNEGTDADAPMRARTPETLVETPPVKAPTEAPSNVDSRPKAPQRAPEPDESSVEMSRPTVPPAVVVPQAAVPAGAASAPGGAASAPAGTAAVPEGGKPVTDKTVLEELQRQLRSEKR